MDGWSSPCFSSRSSLCHCTYFSSVGDANDNEVRIRVKIATICSLNDNMMATIVGTLFVLHL